MVDETMIVVNLDLLAITLAVLVCALAIALRILWEYRCKHKATLRELHETLDELAGFVAVQQWVDSTAPRHSTFSWCAQYRRIKEQHLP